MFFNSSVPCLNPYGPRGYAYGTAFWLIKAQIGTPSLDTGRAAASAGDKKRSQPLSTKKQCHMHFIARQPTCLTDN